MDETNTEETRWQMSNPETGKKWKATCYDPLCELHNPNPTTGEWTLVPVGLDGYTHHFKVMQSNVLIYEGITSESQGAHLINAHNAALAAEREIKSAEKKILLDEIATNQQLREQLAVAVEALKRIDDGTTDFTTSGIVKSALEKVKDGK